MRSRGELSVFANNLGDISVTSTARAVHLTLSFFSLGSRSLIRGDFSSCPARSANCRSAQSVILFARFIPGLFRRFPVIVPAEKQVGVTSTAYSQSMKLGP